MNEIKQIVETVAETNNDGTIVTEADYISDDGLVYCGKCHTPKQCRVKIMGEEITPYVPCYCRQKELERQELDQKLREMTAYIENNRRKCFPDRQLMSWSFDNSDNNEIRFMTVALNYCKNFAEMYNNGCGLMFYGDVGVGKTFAAACVANRLIDKGKRVFMTDFSRIINTLWGLKDGKQDYLDNLNCYDLLIIDDFASERNTEYANEIVMNVIDSRCRSGKPLIITTNLPADEVLKSTDISKKRIYSRICKMCLPVKCEGRKDYRKTICARNNSKFRDILGL